MARATKAKGAAAAPPAHAAPDTRKGANEAGAPDDAPAPEALPQGAASGVPGADPSDGAGNPETSGLLQELPDIHLTVTAAETKAAARLFWLAGQTRTFQPDDLDEAQLVELRDDPAFDLEFHPAR